MYTLALKENGVYYTYIYILPFCMCNVFTVALKTNDVYYSFFVFIYIYTFLPLHICNMYSILYYISLCFVQYSWMIRCVNIACLTLFDV